MLKKELEAKIKKLEKENKRIRKKFATINFRHVDTTRELFAKNNELLDRVSEAEDKTKEALDWYRQKELDTEYLEKQISQYKEGVKQNIVTIEELKVENRSFVEKLVRMEQKNKDCIKEASDTVKLHVDHIEHQNTLVHRLRNAVVEQALKLSNTDMGGI